MAKKKESKKNHAQKQEEIKKDMEKKLPKDVQEKLKKIKDKLDKFSKGIVKKFDEYIMGVALLPPPKPEPGKEIDKKKINVMILVDDSDSKKMTKFELKDKLTKIIKSTAEDIDKNIEPQVVIVSELWQSCYDCKYELLQLIALSAPIYDKGMLAAVKIAEVHKTMILKKFEKYIVSYVLAGSLTQGKATKTSDIDVFIVVDDTDVKRMTRAELKDKLRAIIIGMGIEAGEMTGIKNKLNIQVYILTDFWDSLKEANPVIFTLLRDGIPFFDRGMFMPWKQLLKMGKIKPSTEAIDMFMGTGEQMLKRVRFKLKDIGMEDTYWAILTPSQAALMLYGIAPPTPSETPRLMREIFVVKEKLLEQKFVDILEKNIDIRKSIEHGETKGLTGKEIDELLNNADKYLKRIKRLFKQIGKLKEKDSVLEIHESVISLTRDILKVEGVERVEEDEILSVFKNEIVVLGKVGKEYQRILESVIEAKKLYDKEKLAKYDISKLKKDSNKFIKFVIEYIQRKRGRELERAKIRVKHGDKYGEVLLLDNEAYIVHDIDAKKKKISKANVKGDGSLSVVKESSLNEFEKKLTKTKIPPKTFIKEPIFEDLKKIFGKDVEILINQ